MIIDPVSKLHMYVLPFEVFGLETKLVVPYSTCMMLADTYLLHENKSDQEYMNSDVSCVSYRRFRTQDKTEQPKCYNDTNMAREAIFSKYATHKNEYGQQTIQGPNIVTDILIAQFNRYISAEICDSHDKVSSEFKPISLIYIKPPTDRTAPHMRKLYAVLSTAIKSITLFWQDTLSMLNSKSLMYKHSIRSNFMKAVTTAELVRLQNKAQLGLKVMRDVACLVIVHDQGEFVHAFCYHVDRLVTDVNRKQFRDEIVALARTLVPAYGRPSSSQKIDIFYLPALRAYGMHESKIQNLTSGFLDTWCNGLLIETGNVTSPLDSNVVQKILTQLAYVVIGSSTSTKANCEGNPHLVYNLTAIQRELVPTLKLLLKMDVDIFRVYFLNIYSAYFVQVFSGVECNKQTFYSSADSIRSDLAATIGYAISNQIGNSAEADRFQNLIKKDRHVYLKMVNCINSTFSTSHGGQISDSNVLGRCLLYAAEEKNENLICSVVSTEDCALAKFAKKMSTPQKATKEQEASPRINNGFGSHVTIGNSNTITFAPVEYKPITTSRNHISEVESDITSLATKIAAAISDRMGPCPTPIANIPRDEFRNQSSPANNVPHIAPNQEYESPRHQDASASYSSGPSSSQQPTIQRRSYWFS